MDLNPWYVTGLAEGEGCFSVSFSLRAKLNVGIETRPSFSISLNRRDVALIKAVRGFFKCGGIRYSKSDRTFKYEVRNISDLVKQIIPHFEAYPLMGEKKEDFVKFREISRMVRANLHLSKKHLTEIINIAYAMNPSGKRKHTREYLLRILGAEKV